MTKEQLTSLVAGDGVAIRVRQRLQPAGGRGDKVFPPTYATGDNRLKYAGETRRVDGKDVPTVLLDSVASQANRMEEVLLSAWEREELTFPVIGVDFSSDPALADLGKITALQAPHRIADAILRDSTSADGRTLFRDMPEGKAYTEATTRNATAIYRYCPTALLFGVWDSTGPKGGLGSKIPRALTSEIVGLGASWGRKVESRLDPLAIQANVQVFHDKANEDDWTIEAENAKLDKNGKPVVFSRKGNSQKGNPSAINHSNIPPSIDEFAGGVTFDEAVQTVVLSLPALRRLRFQTAYDGSALAQRAYAEISARTALAALGLAAIVHLREQGYDLRSRCLLVPDGALTLEVIRGDGTSAEFSITKDEVNAVAKSAAASAAEHGLAWEREPFVLKPAAKLAALVKRSRAEAAAGGNG